jgi:hypothetical protein
MKDIAQLREAATNLSTAHRAELAVYLLGTLENTHHWVDDEEVIRRRDELDSGEVKALSREEFNQACGR